MEVSKTVVCGLLSWVVLYSLPALSVSGQQLPGSPQRFVQRFYDWYVPLAIKSDSTPSWNQVLRYRGSSLSSELVRRLREDADAQAKVKGEMVGLDFDPFLNAQDPCERYRV